MIDDRWYPLCRAVCTQWHDFLWKKNGAQTQKQLILSTHEQYEKIIGGAKFCSFLASQGALTCLKWARNHGCVWNSDTCASAACGGHLDLLKSIRLEGCNWSWTTCHYAAQQGHLEILKWAVSEKCPWNPRKCMFVAIKEGHLEVMLWIKAKLKNKYIIK